MTIFITTGIAESITTGIAESINHCIIIYKAIIKYSSLFNTKKNIYKYRLLFKKTMVINIIIPLLFILLILLLAFIIISNNTISNNEMRKSSKKGGNKHLKIVNRMQIVFNKIIN